MHLIINLLFVCSFIKLIIMKIYRYLILFVLIIEFSSCSKMPDKIFINGRINTLDSKSTIVEAIAVKDGEIIDLGSTKDIKDKYAAAQQIDLKGAFVVPGFIDCDGNLIEFAKNLPNINLPKFNSRNELDSIVKIYSKNYNENIWIKVMYLSDDEATIDSILSLSKDYLDKIDSTHNLYVVNRTEEVAVCNSKILNTLKITENTKSPRNGEIEKDSKTGNLTGFLFDEATDLINENLRVYSKDDMLMLVEKAAHELTKYGIIEVHDRNVNRESISIFRQLIDNGKFPIKMYAVLSGGDEAYKEYLTKGIEENYKDKLTVRAVSMDYDGGFGFQDASMFREYKQEPKIKIPYNSEKEIENTLREAWDKSFQVNIKAVGDKAVNITLQSIEKVTSEKSNNNHRTILESAEFINENDYQKITSTKVIPSIKPETSLEDLKILPQIISEDNAKNLGQWQKMLNSAKCIITGSDFPFQQISPLIQMYYLTTRMFPIDTSVTNASLSDPQRLSILDALKSYTKFAAYSGFEENIRGSLEKGKKADFVVLSDDILNIEPKNLLKIKIIMTVISGIEYTN